MSCGFVAPDAACGACGEQTPWILKRKSKNDCMKEVGGEDLKLDRGGCQGMTRAFEDELVGESESLKS